jgi:hypothetical protein
MAPHDCERKATFKVLILICTHWNTSKFTIRARRENWKKTQTEREAQREGSAQRIDLRFQITSRLIVASYLWTRCSTQHLDADIWKRRWSPYINKAPLRADPAESHALPNREIKSRFCINNGQYFHASFWGSYKPERSGFQIRRAKLIFPIYLLLPTALGPEVYSASNTNE